MLTREQEKELEIQRQEMIKSIDVTLDKVCLSNDYELYDKIEREIDDNLTGFKWFDIEKLKKIESILKTNRITKRFDADEDLPQKKQKRNISRRDEVDIIMGSKSKKAHILSFYLQGMSVKELSIASGIDYRNCYNALKSINKI